MCAPIQEMLGMYIYICICETPSFPMGSCSGSCCIQKRNSLPMKQGACPPIGQFRHSRLSLVCAAALPCGCPCRASGASDEDVHGAVHHVDVGVGPGKHGAHILEAALKIFRGSWQIFSHESWQAGRPRHTTSFKPRRNLSDKQDAL